MTTATRSEVDELLARTAELSERVETLIALHEEERRSRESLRDFQADLGLVSSIAMERSIEWLDERRIDTAAVVELLAGLAQAAPQLEKSIGTLVSVGELAGEVGDVGGVVFESAIGKLDELGRKGYFTFLGRPGAARRQRRADPEHGQGDDPAGGHADVAAHGEGRPGRRAQEALGLRAAP